MAFLKERGKLPKVIVRDNAARKEKIYENGG
jgi:hypothetical protein